MAVKRTLVITPAYNEQGSLPLLAKKIQKLPQNIDWLVINDSSTDKTASILREIGIMHVDLPMNLGIGGAMQAGYQYARKYGYDYAIQVDGDGQHDPNEILKLIAEIEKGKADLVIGSRFVSKTKYRQTIMRRLGIGIFALVTKILIGQSIKDATSGFRIVNKKVIALFADNYPSDYPEPEVLVSLTKRNLKILEIPVEMNERETGKSSITSLRSVYYMIKVFFAMLVDKIRKVEDASN